MPGYIDKINEKPGPYPECKKPTRPNLGQKPDGYPAPLYEPPLIYEEGETSEKG
jgi:hypothetical protein